MAIASLRPRAAHAADPARSRGRLFAEPDDPNRNPFRRDCDRIIHSTAFRRLKHKTQVFVFDEGDHFRTRLTHTLEVVQIARSLARALGLDEDLAEAAALAHDLGHTPFGHAGERALDRAAVAVGGFDHNAQSLRVVTRLERRYALFDGLNLSWETLEALVKHNGPLLRADGSPVSGKPVPVAILAHMELQDLGLASHATAEAQVAAVADDIAYDAHDIDDGLRAGFFTFHEIAAAVPFIGAIVAGLRRRHPGLEPARLVAETLRAVITRLIGDVIAEADRRVAAFAPASAGEVRALPTPLVGFSAEGAEADRSIKAFLFPKLYRSERIDRVMGEAQTVVADLYRYFDAAPEAMPAEWARGLETASPERRGRRVADYIAGMTDRYALDTHRRLFDRTPDLR